MRSKWIRANLSGLRQHFLANARRNLLLGSELVRLVAVFGNAGLDVLAFKGPAVSWTLYENPALREMDDLDLLVRPRDARHAYELLISAGYDPVYPALHWRFLQSHNNEAPLIRGEINVDLHWETTPRNFRPERDSEAAWHRSRRVPLAGGSVPTFAPEDLLIFLSVHGGKHCWTGLKWLADISRLVTREPIDWHAVFERARAGESTRAVLLALALVSDLLGVPIPSPAEELFRRDRGGKHCWTGLKWLADISRLVNREPIDWHAVFERARAGESTRAVLLALALVSDVLGVPIPSPTEELFRRDRVAQRLAVHVRAVLTGSDVPAGRLSPLRFWLDLSPSLASKARVLWQPVRPQVADQLAFRLPVSLSGLHYLTRPVRLAAKYTSRLLRLV